MKFKMILDKETPS